MRYEILHLKDFFPALGENGRDATLAAYLPDNLTEMGRDNEAHPSLLICPGGAYCFCSQREAFRTFQQCLHVTPLNYLQSYRLQMLPLNSIVRIVFMLHLPVPYGSFFPSYHSFGQRSSFVTV